jgi:hypothetical protein
MMVWLAPWLIAQACPEQRGVLEFTAVTLPVGGCLLRFCLGKRLVERNFCGKHLRYLQFTALALVLSTPPSPRLAASVGWIFWSLSDTSAFCFGSLQPPKPAKALTNPKVNTAHLQFFRPTTLSPKFRITNHHSNFSLPPQ